MKRILILFVLLLVPSVSFAQVAGGETILSLMPEEKGLINLDYTYSHKAPFRNYPNEKVGSFGIKLNGSIPVQLSDNVYLGLGADYYLHYFRLYNITNYLPENGIYVHNVGPMLDCFIVLNDSWVLDVNFSPTIASDLKEFSGHDIQLNGFVLAGWAFADSASLLFGIGASKEFWTYLPYPLLGFVFRPEDSFFEAEAVLPSYARANFKIIDMVRLFIKADFEGFVWDVKGEAGVPNHFMKFIDTHLGAGVSVRIFEGFFWDTWGGANPYRKYHYRDRTGQAFTERQKIGFFFRTSLTLTPKIFGF